MAAEILSGKAIADAIKQELKEEIAKLDFNPGLAVVRIGEDPASAVYVANKVKTAAEIGMLSRHCHLPAETSEKELLDIVKGLNEDSEIDGILIQLPLPRHISEQSVLDAVSPEKDVDGFHPINVGKLATGQESLVPCTPAGVIEILKRYGIEVAGKHAVVVGRSNIVGKPLAMLLLKNHATVTICHSKTRNLPEITRQADILIAAIGNPGFISKEHIKEGAVVIDVGINKVFDEAQASELFGEEEIEKRLIAVRGRGFTLVGDVNPKDARAKAGKFTPVPGGVGLLTIAMLMKNTMEAARARRGL